MKKQLLIFLLTFITSGLIGQCDLLYIGGVIDGPLTGGTPKAIQLCATGQIYDLSIYGLGVANNGGGSDGQEYTLPQLGVSPGQCFWISTNSADFNTFFGFDPCFTSGIASINGDDPIELFCLGSLQDEFGDVALDGTGECWEYTDGWAVNNSGTPNYGAFNCADWTFSGTNALDGETSNASAANPYPSPEQTCPIALPVKLVSFSAISQNKAIDLSWSTATETNNDYFEIQHSRDGKYFNSIGVVKGNGNTNRELHYTYTHKNPSAGVNYYRLKQVDLDGKFELTFIVQADNRFSNAKVYPTHITNTLFVEIDEIENVQLTIINNYGEIIKKMYLNDQRNAIDISLLPAGIYYAKIESGAFQQIERIIKI